MRLGLIGRWALRQAFGRTNGDHLIWLIDSLKPEHFVVLVDVLRFIQIKGIEGVVEDLKLISEIDAVLNDGHSLT